LPEQDCYAAMTIGGERVWKKYTDMVRKSDDFDVIGHDFEKNGNIINGLIGHADSKVFSMVEAVDYAAEWMIKNRGQGV